MRCTDCTDVPPDHHQTARTALRPLVGYVAFARTPDSVPSCRRRLEREGLYRSLGMLSLSAPPSPVDSAKHHWADSVDISDLIFTRFDGQVFVQRCHPIVIIGARETLSRAVVADSRLPRGDPTAAADRRTAGGTPGSLPSEVGALKPANGKCHQQSQSSPKQTRNGMFVVKCGPHD